MKHNFYEQILLINSMRFVWEQHVYWTRLLLVSIAERLKDLPEVTARLMQNPKDIAGVFAPYYGGDAAKTIAALLTEHLQIGAELITALRDKNPEADDLVKKWYANADKMAEAFSSLNPNYNHEELQAMLRRHLDLTTREVAARLAGDYHADIQAFDEVEKEAISMADYFSLGIIMQFPEKFA